MTVNVIEVLTGSIAASGNAVVPIATSLVSTDRVVVLFSKSGTGGTPTVTAVGSWTNHAAGASQRDNYIYSATGFTGSISPQLNIGTNSGDYVILVLRSDLGNQVDFFFADAASGLSLAINTPVGVDRFYVLAGALVCGSSGVGAGTMAWPHSGGSPTGGWTTDISSGTNSGAKFMHQTVGSNMLLDTRLANTLVGGQQWWSNIAVFYDQPVSMLQTVFAEVVVSYAEPSTATMRWGLPTR